MTPSQLKNHRRRRRSKNRTLCKVYCVKMISHVEYSYVHVVSTELAAERHLSLCGKWGKKFKLRRGKRKDGRLNSIQNECKPKTSSEWKGWRRRRKWPPSSPE
jgi:hypothetical protein